jgi:cellulose biosynthesis protein BcsQ
MLPDKIITNGGLGKKLLVEQGYDTNLIDEGPSLRQFNINRMSIEKNRYKIMLLCPYDSSTACEAIFKLHNALNSIKNIVLSVELKAHPMMNKDQILKLLPHKKLPEHWKWNDLEISSALKDIYCCICISSASIFDAILNDCVVIPLKRELSSMSNFADIFKNEYDVLNEIEDTELSKKIIDIIEDNNKYYETQFNHIKKTLIENINPVNDKFLQNFTIK